MNLIFLLWFPGLLSSSTGNSYNYAVERESWVSISGTSSINTFECYSNTDPFNGNLSVTVNNNGKVINFADAQMNLGIKTFDCNNHLLNRDLYKALGADQTPNISIELIGVEPLNTLKDRKQKGLVNAIIAITLNARCKIVEFPIYWEQESASLYRFMGNKELRMTDFGIQPPSPAFGLIKVSNNITISFSMLVRTNSVMFDSTLIVANE